MKTCPFCAEEIQDAAIVCKHCGRDLAAAALVSVAGPAVAKIETPTAKSGGAGCLIVIGALGFLILALAAIGSLSGSRTRSEPSSVTLNATARFSGTQIIVSNTGSTDWRNVKLDVNGGVISSGYVYRADLIRAGSTVTIGALQFAKSDGTRLNPFQVKPQEITISATVEGKLGLTILKWN